LILPFDADAWLHCCSYLTSYSLLLFFYIHNVNLLFSISLHQISDLQRTKSHMVYYLYVHFIRRHIKFIELYIHNNIYKYVCCNCNSVLLWLAPRMHFGPNEHISWPLYYNIYLPHLFRGYQLYIYIYIYINMQTTYAWHVFKLGDFKM